jgi:hypothetical protein
MEIVGGFLLKIVFCKTGAFTDKLAPASTHTLQRVVDACMARQASF